MDETDLDMTPEKQPEPVIRRISTLKWVYFQHSDGPMFCWNTKRRPDGSWSSFVCERHSFGWTVTEGSLTSHRLRREAKARALALFEGWCLGGNGTRPR